MVPMASRVSILSSEGLPKGREYKRKSARNHHDGFVHIASSYFLADHGRNTSTPCAGNPIFSPRDGYFPTMVRLLVIFRSTYDSVADVCLPIGHSLNWTDKEDSDRAG